MPNSPMICRSGVFVAALIAATGGAASVGRTQQVAGSIGVSLTILEATSTPQPRATGIDLDRDGVARIEMMLPASARTSQLVMARVSSSTTGFTPVPQPPRLIAPPNGTRRVHYLVSLGGDRRADRAQPMELRVEYLIVVAGT
ncbi:MAG TPA: hypothetical protein VF461_10080 [Gemmatimonadaceae bacterium]